MPAIALGTVEAARFDIVGSRDSATNIVLHVGLIAEDTALAPCSRIRAHDMGPPLNVEPPTTFEVAVHGSLPLTRDEQEGIDEWLAEIKPLASGCKYIALPAAELKRDPVTGQIARWEFSCAGFVATAYERGANVVLIDQSQLPPLSLEQAHRLWGNGSRLPVFARLASGFGLKGDGPWPVLVPGHIIHALARERSALPYSPAPTDITFL